MNRMFRRPGLCSIDDPAAGDPPGGGDPPATPAPPAPPAGHFADSFSDGTIKAHPGIRKFENPEALGRSYLELERKIGAKGVVLPGPDATPQDVRAAFTEIGCPADGPDAYNLGDYKPPEGVEIDEDFAGKLRQACWNRGLANDVFAGLYADFVGITAEETQSANELAAQQNAELHKTLDSNWGTAKTEKLARAKAAAQAIWGDDAAIIQFTDLGDGTALGNNPGALGILAQLGELMEEHDLLPGLPPRLGRSAEEAKREIAKLMGDPDFIRKYHTASDPGHSDAIAQMNTLNAQAYPETAQTGQHGSIAGRGVG